MNVAVLLNAAAGPDESATVDQQIAQIRTAFQSLQVQAEVHAVPGPRLTDIARQFIRPGFDAVVAAGGDGTVSAVAAALADTQMPLGILPLGTLNHFAKDLDLPQSLLDAAAVIAGGSPRALDLAEVNGHTFINNSSIGLYPRIVGHREKQRQQLGRGKWPAMFIAVISALRRLPIVYLRLTVENHTMLLATPFIFIGNNAYQFDLFSLGSRNSLDAGKLCLYFPTRTGRFGLLRVALHALLGQLRQAQDFTVTSVPEAWIETPVRRVRVSIDGEVVSLAPPLHYRIHPRALRVMLPRQQP